MKRLTALLLAALFLVMPLAGCSSDKEKDSTTKMSCSMIGTEYVEADTVREAYCAGDED